jgi:hypothetical protein
MGLVVFELDKFLPGVRAGANFQNKIVCSGTAWLPLKFHACFSRKPIPFATIAHVTRTSRVGPNILAATRLWQNVIYRHIAFRKNSTLYGIAWLYQTVDACVVVSCQDSPPAPRGGSTWDVNVRFQRNDGGDFKLAANTADETSGDLNHNGLLRQNQVYGTWYTDNVKWFPCTTVE